MSPALDEGEGEEVFALATEAEEGQEVMVTNLTEVAVAGKPIDIYNHIYLVNQHLSRSGLEVVGFEWTF